MANIFFIMGPEPLQFREKVQWLCEETKKKYGEFAFNVLVFKEHSLLDICQELSSPAFFGGKKVTLIKNFPPPASAAPKVKKSEEDENEKTEEEKEEEEKKGDLGKLLKILEEPLDDSVIIFASLNPDRRTSAYKTIVSLSKEVHPFPLFDPKNGQREILLWIQQRAKQYGLSFASSHTLEFFRMFVGTSFLSLDQELQKLILYCGSNPVQKEDIENICISHSELPGFALSNAASTGDLQTILKIEEELAESDEAATIFNRDLAPLVRTLLRVGVAIEERKTAADIGMHPFPFQNAQKSLKKVSRKRLKEALFRLQEMDALSKIGQLPLTGDTRIFLLEMEKVLLGMFKKES